MEDTKEKLMSSYGFDTEDQLVAWIQNTLVKSDADALLSECIEELDL